MKTTPMSPFEKKNHLAIALIFYFLHLEPATISYLKKAREYGGWFLTSYQLYTKTKHLVTLKEKCISNATACEIIDDQLFMYQPFKKAALEALFHKRLAALKKTWKSWTVSPTYEWAREYGVILFTLYKTIFEQKLSSTVRNKPTFLKHFSLETFWLYIRSVNNQISSLPLEAILQTIELLAEAIPTFFEENQTSFTEINFIWIKKYWWAIIITGIPVYLKIMIIFKNHEYHQRIGAIDHLIGTNHLILPHSIGSVPGQRPPPPIFKSASGQ